MEQLHKQVRRAQWRLALQRFVGVLGWCWFGTLCAAAGLIALDKFYPMPVAAWVWPAAAVGLGLLAAVLWTALGREQPLSAAIEIDRRFGLKERVSSVLAMPAEQHQTDFGQALMHDALRRVERIDVAEKFAVAPPRQLLLPLLPGLLAVLVAVFVEQAVVENPAEAKTDAKTQEQVQKSTQALQRRLAERREEAEKKGLKEAERLLRKIEEGSRNLSADPPERKKALVELNDLARQLQARRDQLDGSDKIKQQLDQLNKHLERGPADRLAQALSKGKFAAAAKELEKIKEQISQSKLDDQQKDQLARQLDQMREKLQKMAEAQKAARADLEQRAEQARQNGQAGEANRLEEQLQKLLQQAPQMDRLQDIAQKLGECAQCMKNGQLPDAQQAIDQLQSQLGDLQKQLDEMQMLDDAMQQIAQAKQKMNCGKCGGAGCEACLGGLGDGQGQGKGKGDGFGQGEGDGDGEGMGLGKGQGAGARPEEKTATGSYQSLVRPEVGPGAADVVGTAHGPNVKGNVEERIREQVESARQGTTDPLSGQRIPRKHRQHAQEYFDRFREGK